MRTQTTTEEKGGDMDSARAGSVQVPVSSTRETRSHRVKTIKKDLEGVVREHPLLSVAGALAVGVGMGAFRSLDFLPQILLKSSRAVLRESSESPDSISLVKMLSSLESAFIDQAMDLVSRRLQGSSPT